MARSAQIVSVVTLWLSVGLAACSGADDRPPHGERGTPVASTTGDRVTNLGTTVPQCVHGDRRSCVVYLPTHNGVETCYKLEQHCVDGAWLECGDEPEELQNDADAGQMPGQRPDAAGVGRGASDEHAQDPES